MWSGLVWPLGGVISPARCWETGHDGRSIKFIFDYLQHVLQRAERHAQTEKASETC